MKILKTRIKKTTKANGSVNYVAEYKWGFWWYQFDDCNGPDDSCRHTYYAWLIKHRRARNLFRYTEESAKDLIQLYIERVNYYNACKIENRLIKTEYEDFL